MGMKDDKIDLSKVNLPKMELAPNIPEVDFSKILESQSSLNSLNNTLAQQNKEWNAIYQQMAEEKARKIRMENDNHEHLSRIAENTQGIKEIVEIVRQGNEINQKTFELFQELQKIMLAKSKEEGEAILRDVLDKANQAKEDIDTIQTLIGYGRMLMTMVSSFLS